MVKEIPLGKSGKVAIVDDDWYEMLSVIKWQATGKYASAQNFGRRPGKKQSVKMHRLILEAPKGMQIDHINRDGLDNRRENLRICTRAQNGANRGSYKASKTSKYKGVHWCPSMHVWRAIIYKDGKQVRIRHFPHEEDAARCYNIMAKEVFGEFACLNDVLDAPLPRAKGWDRKGNLYIARVQINGKKKHVGSFRTPEEATAAYELAVIKYHGNKAAWPLAASLAGGRDE